MIAHSETLNPTTHASTFSETFTSVSTEQQTTQATDIVEQETEQTHASSENDEPMAPTPASVSVGNSTLKSTLSTGTYNQDIITLSYGDTYRQLMIDRLLLFNFLQKFQAS